MDGYENHRVRLLVGSDCRYFLEQFHLFIRYHSDIHLLGTVPQPAELPIREELSHTDIVLLNTPVLDAKIIEILRRVHIAHPQVKGLITAGVLPQEFVAGALKWGARGFLPSPCLWQPYATMYQWEVCVRAIRTVEAGELWIGRKALAQALMHLFCEMDYKEFTRLKLTRRLTTREQEIVSLIAKGMTNKQVAKQLGISDKTVKAHLERIFTKLRVNRRTQLAEYAYEAENGLPWKGGSRSGSSLGVI